MKKFLVLFFISFFSINLFSLELYKSNVTASFYGADFHGKKTSNGELFNMNDLTCAHKSLPFDTIAFQLGIGITYPYRTGRQ